MSYLTLAPGDASSTIRRLRDRQGADSGGGPAPTDLPGAQLPDLHPRPGIERYTNLFSSSLMLSGLCD